MGAIRLRLHRPPALPAARAFSLARPLARPHFIAARFVVEFSFPEPTHANILGVRVEALNMHRALHRVAQVLRGDRKGYVSVVGVHGIMEAQRNPSLAAIYANSAITVPDGMPTVWVGRLQGCQGMERVAGPDLMLEVFRNPRFARCTHFIYGGDPGVADELAANLQSWFPWVRIVGTYTPPFRDLTSEETADLVETIEKAKPDIMWVGIGAPRQEEFMASFLPLLQTKLMFGVGAAFDFHTGRIRDCSPWIKKAGLQWLHRLLQDPRRLWRRYLRNNPAFLWSIALQLIGLRSYPEPVPDFHPQRPFVPAASAPLRASSRVANTRTATQ